MAAGETDREEETLQTAFKKLRVDAESALGAASAPESPRVATRVCADVGAVKSKLGGAKDNWHGCVRKTSRAASRTQRRRRSKSPILQAARFTYCSASALAPPGGCLKQQRLAAPTEPRPDRGSPATCKDLATPGALSPTSTAVFGSTAGYVTPVGAAGSSPDFPARPLPAAHPRRDEECSGRVHETVAESADFQALSKLHSCTCTLTDAVTERQDVSECPCRSKVDGWNSVEAYSFTGLRDVISECEHQQAPPRTDCSATASLLSSSPASPRSCSEQARVFVDDVTIEDLSGYMEFYLYIPKKMSHMAEMMYT
ncbi:oxidative stress-responsive serine-rich protein 1 [Dunckerocampus dactyliophorus]|uniref:oxidative stress-responsive serine-rich protein 1 n=1 Tax=Dunckerocampus dactyliophorus TaxID=161453 RepID=UPI002406439E|nr:oxidative stress-responsive serine-rich protein 1 [Dunckerocampus dactyliophorus]